MNSLDFLQRPRTASLRPCLMQGRILTLLGVVLLTLAPGNAFALVSFQSTASAGYYRDIDQETQTPIYLYWTLQHSTPSDFQTYIDLGANNDLAPGGDWRFYLYQGYVTVPVSKELDRSPYHLSRIQLGRQLLVEGFELGTLDGAEAPYYFSDAAGLTLTAGSLTSIEAPDADFRSQIYGGAFHGNASPLQYKAGYFHKIREGQTANLAYGSLNTALESLAWSPTALVKSQWALETGELNQFLADLQLYPSDTFMLGFEYSSRQPNALDVAETRILYELFAISTQQTVGTSATWSPQRGVRIQGRVRGMNFDSSAGQETADQEDLAIVFETDRSSFIPSLTRIQSYGGTVVQTALSHKQSLSDTMELRNTIAAAHIDKINGITGWAYDYRGGLNFKLGSRFVALALLEIERNHVFEFDARAVAYVSHFFY